MTDLAHRRTQLRERIAAQRSQLAREAGLLLAPIARADKVLDWARNAIHTVKSKPYLVTGMVASLWVLKPRRVWRLARWGWAAWRQVNWLRAWQR